MALDETLEQVNKKFAQAKKFIRENYPDGYEGNGTYPLYLFYDTIKGFEAHELTSGVQNAYWVFSNKKFENWESMVADLMCKY